MLSANWDPGRSNRLQASPYFATRRSVFRSPLPRVGRVQRAGQVVVPAPEGRLVVAPHLVGDLQRLFQALEPLGQGRERDPEAFGLEAGPGTGGLGVPGGTGPDPKY